MADLEFQGGFDIDPALQSVDQLADALTARLDAALAGLDLESFASSVSAAAADALASPIAIEADASAIPAEVDAALADSSADIPITADTAPAEAEVADLVSSADAEQVEITVAADTTDAQESLDDLASSSQDAASGLDGTAGAASAIGSASTLAGGSVDALTGGIGNLATKAGGAGIAVGAGIATLGGFTAAAINSLGATERLDSTLGTFADRVNTIKVGNLNVDLGELAITTGSSGSGMRNAAVDAFALATSFDKGRGESAQFSAEILALSGRAVALNPKLGETGDVANSLIRALSSGREKALIPFALGITAVDINARAAQIALRDGREEVSQADKAFAGASLAVEKLGGHLKQDIEEGTKNPILQARSLAKEFSSATTEIAKPLVSPALEVLKQAQPSVIAILTPLGRIAESVLPAFASVLSIVAPPLEVVADVIDDLPQPLIAAAAGALLLNAAVGGIGARLTAMAVGEAEAAAGAVVLAEAEGVAATSGAAMTAAHLSLGSALLVVGAGVAAYVLTTKALESVFGDGFGDDVEEVFQNIDKATKQLATTTSDDLLPQFRSLVRDSTEAKTKLNDFSDLIGDGRKFAIGSQAVESLVVFKDLAKENYDQAVLLATQIGNAGGETAAYDTVLQNLAPHQRDNAAATSEARDQVVLLTGSYEEQITVLDKEADALRAQYDAQFASIHAHEGLRDALKELSDARFVAAITGGQDAAANEAQDRALTRVEESALRVADAERRKAESDNEAKGSAIAHSAGVYAQLVSLNALKDTLAPDDPLRIFLQQYIDKLKETEGNHAGSVSLDTSQAETSVHRLLDLLTRVPTGIPGLGGNPQAPGTYLTREQYDAIGRLIEGRAGGGPVEAGVPYLVNENTPNSELFVPRVSGTIVTQAQYATAGGGGGAGGITIGQVVLQQASTNPTREAVSAMKQLRRGAALASLG